MIRLLLQLLLIICAFACSSDSNWVAGPIKNEQNDPPAANTQIIDILALGDSYTKGEGIATALNFPNQLNDSIDADGWKTPVNSPAIIAKTGWRTDQLISAVDAATNFKDSIFSLVTLCIGVNNQYQNRDIETFKREYEALLQTAIVRAGGRKDRVLVLSIPDWAFTDYGQQFSNDPTQISAKIDAFNTIKRTITELYGVKFFDVTTVSRGGLARPDLVCPDGLHPSAKQYTEWVNLLLPHVREVLPR